ncbi:MAG: hypothetical protein Q4B85_04675 [Lachnospiraceae bacterium]|nr:hypothetical protein [Lachnospiraceae bacterium]
MGYKELLTMSRPKSGHLQMDRRKRAKQFAPFDALKGFGESIQEKAVVYSERPLLCGDRKEELNRSLQQLHSGDSVTILYFKEYAQVRPKGRFELISGRAEWKKGGSGNNVLQVEGKEIPLGDILTITDFA